MKRRELTLRELAKVVSCAPERLQALLEEDLRRGLVERVDGRWRLTARAEEALGRCLRELEPPT